MGTASSKQSDTFPRLKNVFGKELESISNVVNNVLSPNNRFISEEYNFLGKDVCEKFTFVLESSLKKHLKVEVQDLHDSLILVPKQNRIAAGQKVINKASLCDVIATHYTKCLYLLCLVKYVYDLEHGGDYSVAGIVQRNMRIVGDLLELNFCALPQKDYERADKRVDFGNLQGLRFFSDNFLTPEEREMFTELFGMVVGRQVTAKAVTDMACRGGTLLSPRDFEVIFGERPQCRGAIKRASKAAESAKPAALVFAVEGGNPILSSGLCMSKKKLVVQLGGDAKSKRVRDAVAKLHADYARNLSHVEQLLGRLVHRQDGCASTLHNMSDQDLAELTADIKRAVVQFYLRPLLAYQRLLDLVKTMPSIRIDVQ